MKTIIATTIALTIATSASATGWNSNGSTKWNGNVGTLHATGCSFKNQTNGTMTLNKETGKWTTTTAASIKVKSKDRNNIYVESDNKLKGTVNGSTQVIDTATVNYASGGVASEIDTNNNNATKTINTNHLYLGSANKPGATVTTFTIGGSAQMSDVNKLDEIDNNQAVWISHTVRCVQ